MVVDSPRGVVTSGLLVAAICGLLAAPVQAVTVGDYIIIATGDSDGDNNVGDALNMQDSEIGAISAESGPLRFNAVSPPQGNPAFPVGTRGPSTGVITLDGDAAVTSTSGRATLSNSDVHSLSNNLPLGSGTIGSRGIDCANSFAGCSSNGISTGTLGAGGSGSGFNETGLPGGPSFSQVQQNNGYQGSVSSVALLSDLTDLRNYYWGLGSTGTLNTTGLNNQTQTLTYASGLNVIDINTGGSDFDLSNSNWIVSGELDTFVIFRINSEAKFNASNSNLLLGGNIGINNILFLVDSKDGNGSFTFNNVEFYGYSFWDYLGMGLKNEAVWNNVRGCGQVIADKVNFNNVSMIGCSFNPQDEEEPPPVPEPGSLALLGLGLAGLGLSRRRKAA